MNTDGDSQEDMIYYEHEFGHLPEAEKLTRIGLDQLVRAFVLARATDKSRLTPDERLRLEELIQGTVARLRAHEKECKKWGIIWG